MRRYAALALLLTLTGQSAASAYPDRSASGWPTDPVSREQAIHHAEPIFPHIENPLSHQWRRPEHLHPEAAAGVPMRVHIPRIPLHGLADPRAEFGARRVLHVGGRMLAPGHGLTLGSPRRAASTSAQDENAGLKPFWPYQSRIVAGIGSAYGNASNGNVAITTTDVDVATPGVDLSFSRVWNSMSLEDTAGDDGSGPSTEGNYWTSNLNAHIVWNPGKPNIISVYDQSGARWDYSASSSGMWLPPVGQHASLVYDGQCGYWWQQPSGVAFYFYNAASLIGCSTPSSLYGRLYAIVGRNQQAQITLTYSWKNGNSNNPENLTQIVAQHSNGQSLTLNFGPVGSNPWTELTSIVRPDGKTIQYSYNGTGANLTEVDKPGNGNAPTETQTNQNGSGQITACNPRSNQSSGSDGNCTTFTLDSSNRVSSWYDVGVPNITPSDGMNQVLQPNEPTGSYQWTLTNFNYGQPGNGQACGGTPAGTTEMCDADGHATVWTMDSLGLPIATVVFVQGSSWLLTEQLWDGNFNLVSTTDVDANKTQYAYDSTGTNLIGIEQPQISAWVNGAMQQINPITTYTHDQNNNVTATCDAVYNLNNGTPWPLPSGGPTCQGAGSTSYTYTTTDSNEPSGCLSGVTGPLGYNVTVSYGSGCGNWGLPTQVQGTTIQSQEDGTARTPTLTIAYDSYGNIHKYNQGSGAYVLSYNALNQMEQVTDADGLSFFACYNNDGTLQYTETPYQHSLDGSPGYCGGGSYADKFQYDADSNQVVEIQQHHGLYASPGPTPSLSPQTSANAINRFYDADDRLVEVEEPQALKYDVYANPWIDRYLYDLTENGSNGTLHFNGGSAYKAHGNLFKSQELLPSGSSDVVTYIAPLPGATPSTLINNTVFQDVRGVAYDALARATTLQTLVTTAYPLPVSSPAPVLNTETISYDTGGYNGNAYYGLPTQYCNALGTCETYGYNTHNKLFRVTGGPNSRSYAFDPDDRLGAVGSGDGGIATSTAYQYAYDANGNLISEVEPSSYNGAGTLKYGYYADNLPEYLGIGGGAPFTQNQIYQYSYRADGLEQTMAINDGQVPQVLHPGTTQLAYTYTSAGRPTQRQVTWKSQATNNQTIGYDANGNINAMHFPGGGVNGGAFTEFEYTADADLLGYNNGKNGNGIQTYNYTDRGELAQGFAANGVWMPPSISFTQQSVVSWDDTMGALLKVATSNVPTSSWGYDGAGRLTNEAYPCCAAFNGQQGSATIARTYDRENHLLSTDTAPENGQFNNVETWGPNGEANTIAASGSAAAETLHWSGDQLLYTTNTKTNVDDVKLGADGDILPLDAGYNGLTLYGRGPESSVGGCYNSDAVSPFTNAYPYFGNTSFSFRNFSISIPYNISACGETVPTTGTPSPAPSMPASPQWSGSVLALPGLTQIGPNNGGTVAMPRPDGITTGTDTIQGARSYDMVSGTWTSPDAFPPNLMDPTTSKPYIWNANNPIQNMDSSGYCPGIPAGDDSISCYDPDGIPFDDPGIDQFMSYYGMLGSPWVPGGFGPINILPPPVLKVIAWVTAHARRPDSYTASWFIVDDPVIVDGFPVGGVGIAGHVSVDRCGRVFLGMGPGAGSGFGGASASIDYYDQPNSVGPPTPQQLYASESGASGGASFWFPVTVGMANNDNASHVFSLGLPTNPGGYASWQSSGNVGQLPGGGCP